MTKPPEADGESYTPEYDRLRFEHLGVEVTLENISGITGANRHTMYENTYGDSSNTILRSTEIISDVSVEGVEQIETYFAHFHLNPKIVEMMRWTDFWRRTSEDIESELGDEAMHVRLANNGMDIHGIGLIELSARSSKDGVMVVMRNASKSIKEFDQTKYELELYIKFFLSIESQLRQLAGLEARKEIFLDLYNETPEIQEVTRQKGDMPEGIYGMHSIREEIADIIMSYENPELMRELDAKPVGAVLLQGLPGVGKTELATALAKRLDASLHIIESKDVIAKYVGESAQNLNDIIQFAKDDESETVVILFDEFDGITNGAGAEGVQNNINSSLKSILKDLSENYPHILVIGTVNDETMIDPAILRSGRFNMRLHVEPPNTHEREELFLAEITALAEKVPVPVMAEVTPETIINGGSGANNSLDLAALAGASEGFTGADIKEVFEKIRRKKAREALRNDEILPLTQADVIEAINSLRLT